jgi:hypothetical protein
MTNEDYKATPEQWAFLRDCAANGPTPLRDQSAAQNSCILELRARVQALEEAENDRRFEQAKAIIDRPAPAPVLAQPEPEVVGPTDDDLEAVFVDWAEWPDEDSDRSLDRSTFVSAARDVLARWGRPAIQPIPVSERLPEVEDCDEHGWCWMYEPDGAWWQVLIDAPHIMPSLTHWLPAHALPIPTSQEVLGDDH